MYPLILYSLGNLLNWNFEKNSDGEAPDDWDTSLSNNEDIEVDNTEYHSAGEGLPSTVSIRMNVDGANVSYEAVVAQRVQMDALLRIAKQTGGEIAVVAMARHAAPAVQNSVHLDMKQYDGTNLTVGEGTQKTPPAERKFVTGVGPEWFMYVTAQTLHADTDRIEVHLRYKLADTGDYGASNYVWFDRVMVGGLIDFPKGMRGFDMVPEGGFAVNEGDGVVEIVKLTASKTDINITLANILEGSDYDMSIKRFLRTLASEEPGICAFWGDRGKFTNGERHFQRVVPSDSTPKIEYPGGFPRRMYKFKLTAFTEFSD